MTSNIATLMPTATLLLITIERVDFMPALAVGMLSWRIDTNQATPFA
jgi:hypothetical protein